MAIADPDMDKVWREWVKVDIPILLNSMRLFASKHKKNHLPITARMLVEGVETIERLLTRVDQLEAENARLKGELLEAQTEASELTLLDIFGTLRQAGVNTKEDLQKRRDEWRAKRNADNGYENPGYRGAVSTNGQEVQD